jgi:hypothetical protein
MRLQFHLCWILFACAALAGADDSSNAACDRECLRGFITQYLNAMIAHQPSDLSLADHFRFTEDTVEMKLGDGPLWKNASRLRPYRLDILDVRQGVAASQAIVEEGGLPVMLMLRLKITGNAGNQEQGRGVLVQTRSPEDSQWGYAVGAPGFAA